MNPKGRALQGHSTDETHVRAGEASTLILPDRAADALEIHPIGAIIEDRYRVVDVRGGKGKTGMGIVYIVEDGGEVRALKTFQRRFSKDLGLVERFIREARTWMLIGFHPNIARADRLDIIEAVPYLFMEYVPSDDEGNHALSDLLAQGPLPLDRGLDLAIQCCDGMIHATSAVPGLVDRDLKPENLLITPDGVLKVTDFGLVRCREMAADSLEALGRPDGDVSGEQGTRAGAVFGTPAYMAPEQFTEVSQVTMASDIYAFGCCLFEMLTGAPPFEGEGRSTMERLAHLRRLHLDAAPPRLRDRLPGCPAKLDRLVSACLVKNPRRRCRHFTELRKKLVALLEAETGHGPRVLPPYEPTAREVAGQMWSMSLLEGYGRAIRMRHLRESQDISPYAFHLALASYFHCHGNPAEERRQLEKAARVAEKGGGYEAARRLSELLVARGDLEEADRVLSDFLTDHPEDLDRVLEPRVRLLAARHAFDEALECLAAFRGTIRAQLLEAEVLRVAGRTGDQARLLREMLRDVLNSIVEKLSMLDPADRVGYDFEADRDRLCETLMALGVTVDCSMLRVTDEAVWPEVAGYPDLASELAWLSHALGELSLLEDAITPEEHSQFTYYAQLLDYPRRLKTHQERDEYWLWLQEPENDEDGDGETEA